MPICDECKAKLYYKITQNSNYYCPTCDIEYYIDNPFYDGDIDYCQDEGE